MQDFTSILEYARGDREPDTGHVYLLRSTEGTILYAGQTVQPLQVRMRGHFHERPALIRASATLEAEEMPSNDLLDAEAKLIHENHPPMNRVCPVEGCYFYVNTSTVRRDALKPVLPDVQLADAVHEAIKTAREAGIDRVFSAWLSEYIEAAHPSHNLKPGQIRQKVTAVIGSESQVIYNPATKKMGRGWYLREHT